MNTFKQALKAAQSKLKADCNDRTVVAKEPTFTKHFNSMDNKELLSSLSDRYTYQSARR